MNANELNRSVAVCPAAVPNVASFAGPWPSEPTVSRGYAVGWVERSETHRAPAGWRGVLLALAALPYVERIAEAWYE